MLLTLLMYLALGAAAGVTAGLFGIGGGLLIVPVLVFSFGAQGISPEILTHMAVATSLATIVVTSISSIRAHHKRGAVRWDLFRPLSLGIVLGAFLGVKTAGQLPGNILQMMIGSFALLVSLQMAFGARPADSPGAAPKPGGLGVAGGLIGWASALFGIGGGTLTVPFLSWRHVRMQQAVATSAACGLPIAVIGALSNVLEGWGHPAQVDWSLGYVYLPAFVGIVLTSPFFAGIGARLAHHLPAPVLRRVFAAFLALVGLRFLLGNLF
ncbi:sulfite exporter TauE/SafE family protein [Marinobacterium rhizophilum]|uniref:Probable membrane transporter protein n=1 Tax=Marinobacterium rhizophilum TaxID=420402 RepID=A0ABY5HIC5_9GAMM|nr:sulfite exporter TauE/SafE family protein [Marinobacterium rhizophilum]UTW11015.1 sulfite exporter TauE/SafE family protein [Marinobacterium rhizophilum]